MIDLISVIVPVYRVEEYLNRCVDSVLRQTYGNFELILVDDGSPDNCGKICDEYSITDSRVKVIHKENGGLSDARNTGIELAQGSYLTFIDSDDWVHEKYLETLYNLAISKNADISICNFVKTATDIVPVNNENAIIYEYSNYEALSQLSGEFYVQMVIACAKLYKSDLFKEIRFPLGKTHEDEFTTYKLLYRANKIAFTTEPLLYYWQRSDSIMGEGFKIVNKLHAIEAMKERIEFFETIGKNDLKDKTYKSLFGLYKEVNDNIHLFETEQLRNDFLIDLKCFRSKLRKSKQKFKFKLYCETYFISPQLAHVLEFLNKSIHEII